jgi:hypothetical protein
MLDRVRDLASRCLGLQSALRASLVRQQQQRNLSVVEGVTFSELSAIRHLRIANDGLRWQLLQRDRSLQSFQTQLSALEGVLEGLREQQGAAEKELNDLLVSG